LRETIPVAAVFGVAFILARVFTVLEARSPGAVEQFLAKPAPAVRFGYVPIGATNNVVIVDVNTDVQRTSAEMRVMFTGPSLSMAAEDSVAETFPIFNGIFVKPLPFEGNQAWRIRPVGRQI
jgi:hypothetical protein